MAEKRKVRVYKKLEKAQDGMEAGQEQPQGQPQGGGEDPMQQVMQMAQQMAQEGADPMQIAQALMQQGVPPEVVGQVLVEIGVPQEQVQQVVEQAMQGGQEGAPPQQGGQPQMAQGGQAGQQEQMQQIMQMVQEMTEQGADPMQITSQLMSQGVPAEAVGQILVQMGMPEEQVTQVIQQASQGAPEGMPEGAGQMMANGGEKDEFNKRRKAKIKEYRKGGMTDESSLSTASTADYTGGLTNALAKVMFTGHTINSISKMGANADRAFNEIPMAENGVELDENGEPVTFRGHEISKEKDNAEIPSTNVDLNTYLSENNISTEDYKNNVGGVKDAIDKTLNITSQPKATTENNEVQFGVVGGNQSGKKYPYFPGWNAEGQPNAGRDGIFGRGQGAGNNRGRNGELIFKGYGDASDMTFEQFRNSIGKTHEITNESLAYKQKFFGRGDRRHTAKNVIGKNFDWRLIGSGDEQEAANNGVKSLEDTLAQHNLTMEDYKSNPYVKREMDAIVSPNNPNSNGQFIPINSEPAWLTKQRDEENSRFTRREGRKSEKKGAIVPESNSNYGASLDHEDKIREMAERNLGAGKSKDEYLDEMDRIDAVRERAGTKQGDYRLPENAYGGTTGSPFRWDPISRKFLRLAEDGASITEESSGGFNNISREGWNVGLDLGHKASDVLSWMNSYTSEEDRARNRSMDNLVEAKDSNDITGVRGVYGVNSHRQMPDGTGADIMPGTGTDWEGFGKGLRTNFKDSFLTGAYSEGGLYKGATGMEKGAPKTLNKGQLAALEKAGYSLKQIR